MLGFRTLAGRMVNKCHWDNPFLLRATVSVPFRVAW